MNTTITPTPAAPAAGSVLHAWNASPGRTKYVVTESHDHKYLTKGNVVVVVEDPQNNNWLLRLSDMSLHHLTGQSDQYVHLSRADSLNTEVSGRPAGSNDTNSGRPVR